MIAVLLAWFAIRFTVDQVVLGVVLNLFALGLTGFLYEQLMRPDSEKYNQPAAVRGVEDPAAGQDSGLRRGRVHRHPSSCSSA